MFRVEMDNGYGWNCKTIDEVYNSLLEYGYYDDELADVRGWCRHANISKVYEGDSFTIRVLK